METFIIVALSILFFGIIILMSFKNRKIEQIEDEQELSIEKVENSFPNIEIIEDSKLVPLEKNKIVDEDIKNAISIIDNYVPKTAMMSNNIKSANEILNKDRAFFSSAKKGTENMIKVRGTDEVLGTQKVGNKFSKQTKFTREDKLIKSYGKNAVVNAGFNAVSMVVGQYYMNEINNKLDTIQNTIQGIADFLDSEYQSQLAQIVSKMQEMIENKVEILSNDYSRDKRYDEILRLESECGKLLGIANKSIEKCVFIEYEDYKEYEKNIKNIHLWFVRQQLLQQLLLEIGNLRYVLANGNETSKLSHTQYNNYLSQTNIVNAKLENWHKTNCEKFGINKEEQKRKTKLFDIIKNTIGRINEEWAYHKLENNVVAIIESQTNIKRLNPYTNNKQDEEIKIQKYNGEYYNLPSIHK